jgi:hypothetical protein
VVSVAIGIAIVGFGAPPVTIAYVGWGGGILLSIVEMHPWRRVRNR